MAYGYGYWLLTFNPSSKYTYSRAQTKRSPPDDPPQQQLAGTAGKLIKASRSPCVSSMRMPSLLHKYRFPFSSIFIPSLFSSAKMPLNSSEYASYMLINFSEGLLEQI